MHWWCHGTPEEGPSTPQVMARWTLALGGLMVWLRWMKKPWRSPWTHTEWFDHLATLDGVTELLYDDDDLVRSLTCYGTHEHVLGMLKKPMKTWNPWRRLWCLSKDHGSHCLYLTWLDCMMRWSWGLKHGPEHMRRLGHLDTLNDGNFEYTPLKLGWRCCMPPNDLQTLRSDVVDTL